ncbi:MAG TPA: hypothetical protein VFA86_14720 [Gammaproteobacteria bacterium]|nr:hypothetical protein [Gammaproteobacteria bacterium]
MPDAVIPRRLTRGALLLILPAMLVLAGCHGGPDAAGMYARARSEAARGDRAARTSFALASRDYGRALATLDRLVQRYPDSPQARRIRSGHGSLGSRSLATFRKRVVPHMRRLAQLESRADLFDLAHACIHAFATSGGHEALTEDLVDGLVEAGDYARGARLARTLPAPAHGQGSVARILALASDGHVREARAMVQGMQPGVNRTIGRLNLLSGLIHAGDRQAADREVPAIVDGIQQVHSRYQAVLMIMLADDLGRLGRVEDARRIAEGIPDQVPGLKSSALSAVAGAAHKAGRDALARQLAGHAYALGRKAHKASARVEYIVQAATAMAAAGDRQAAQRMFARAHGIARRLPGGAPYRLSAGLAIADGEARAGFRQAASEDLARTVAGFHAAGISPDQRQTGMPVAEVYARTGRYGQAVADLASMHSPMRFADDMIRLAVVYHQAGLQPTPRQKHVLVAHFAQLREVAAGQRGGGSS